MEDTRVCNKCGIEYPITMFGMTGKWIRRQCRYCMNIVSIRSKSKHPEAAKLCVKRWKDNNAEHISNYGKEYYASNLDNIKEYKREYYSNVDNRKSRKLYSNKWYLDNKDNYILKTHGLSPDEHDRLFIKQDGRCAICGIDVCEMTKPLYIDHDHDTGKIRGLLCHYCNTMIGMSRDDPEVLVSAISYLISGSY